MTERKIPATYELEAFINQNGSITLQQSDPYKGDQIVIIELRDVETVRQWLAELYLESAVG